MQKNPTFYPMLVTFASIVIVPVSEGCNGIMYNIAKEVAKWNKLRFHWLFIDTNS